MRRRTRSRSARPIPSRPGKPTIAIAVVAVLALVAAACGGSSDDDGSGAAPGRENVTFYYQQVHADRDLSRFGKVKIVVAAPQVDGQEAAKLIKSTGAKAYRYVQAYWLPESGYSDDPAALEEPDWWFCAEGDEPTVGRIDRQGRDWYFYDMNERAALDHLKARLRVVKAEGWDGVFFDRGYAALTGHDEPDNTNVWDQVSTCTEDPVTPDATFANAFVGAMEEARAGGLEMMLNYGVSPLSPETPLRPDSTNEACQTQEWADCPQLDDAWGGLNSVLDEAVSHPQDQLFEEDYEVNRKNEQDPEHGGQTVGLLTTGTLGENNRQNVFFGWSRVKLFDIPLAVNTGEGGCQGQTVTVCNRHRLYPDLANALLGTPVAERPQRLLCQTGSDVNCLWVRRYSHGMSVVNVSAQPVTAGALSLGVDGCRVVESVWHRKRLEGGECVETVRLTVPAWSGRPLVYSGG